MLGLFITFTEAKKDVLQQEMPVHRSLQDVKLEGREISQ